MRCVITAYDYGVQLLCYTLLSVVTAATTTIDYILISIHQQPNENHKFKKRKKNKKIKKNKLIKLKTNRAQPNLNDTQNHESSAICSRKIEKKKK